MNRRQSLAAFAAVPLLRVPSSAPLWGLATHDNGKPNGGWCRVYVLDDPLPGWHVVTDDPAVRDGWERMWGVYSREDAEAKLAELAGQGDAGYRVTPIPGARLVPWSDEEWRQWRFYTGAPV